MQNRFQEYNVQYISNVMSLRKPQEDSLALLDKLLSYLELEKNVDLQSTLTKVHSICPICTDFERSFPSITFALATGVGKTKLMGAFVAYLHTVKGIRNFFIVAPNLTVYNKLIADFNMPLNPKYVFTGIGAFAQIKPRVITGENYRDQITGQISMSDCTINIFNISKINAETKGGREPLMKRLCEYIGDSYFNFLAAQDDLVLLMDESHHYRAERGMAVLNELNPVLGLELTATPFSETSRGTEKFKNVVYDYPLGRALRDGFVKEPAVATRRAYNPQKHTEKENDTLKLEDGIRIHEDTKLALALYAAENKTNVVKPFILVVARDTTHAAELMGIIQSDLFFGGQYKNRVMQIDSKQTGEEKEENIIKLLTLEDPNNEIEIVIHVNMLKEGWDVTNLYTIIPLRAAASTTLREQTIGRGLRLPYGKRTGVKKVDRLTIVSHDRFEEIVNEANKPDSIIRKENIFEIEDAELTKKELFIARSTAETKLFGEPLQENIQDLVTKAEKGTEAEQKRAAEHLENAIKQIAYSAVKEIGRSLTDVQQINTPEIKQQIVRKVQRELPMEYSGIVNLTEMYEKGGLDKYIDLVIETIRENVIEIPRIYVGRMQEVRCGFHDFDLDISKLNLQPVDEQILIKSLLDNKSEFISAKGEYHVDSLQNLIVSGLMDKPEVDYYMQSDLLFKLADQAVSRLNSYLNAKQVENVMLYYRQDIVDILYSQMKSHFYVEEPPFDKPKVYPFTTIEEHWYEKIEKDRIHNYYDTVEPSEIRKKIFTGFKKALHTYYKFDSNTEKKLAMLLEDDTDVLRWLRPAREQFRIYWDRQNTEKGRYEPDFVVETTDSIWLTETKARRDLTSEEVIKKTEAALVYCKYATEYNLEHSGKPWRYALIPHDENITANSVAALFGRHEVRV